MHLALPRNVLDDWNKNGPSPRNAVTGRLPSTPARHDREPTAWTTKSGDGLVTVCPGRAGGRTATSHGITSSRIVEQWAELRITAHDDRT
jgi:hypothetical protein